MSPPVAPMTAPNFSGSYPGAAHPSVAGPTMGSLPRLAPPMSGSEPGHSSQPSFSNSINHASVASHPQKPASNNRLTLVALGVAAAAGGAAALLYVAFARPSGSVSAPNTSDPVIAAPVTTTAPATIPIPRIPGEPTPSGAPSADAAPKVSKILVKASPDTAEIFLDGTKVGDKGRFEGTVPRDGAEHEIKVDAPGYASKTKTLKPGEDLSWEPELVPNRTAGGTPSPKKTATPAEPTPPPLPTATATGEKRDKNGRVIRPIETSYPGG